MGPISDRHHEDQLDNHREDLSVEHKIVRIQKDHLSQEEGFDRMVSQTLLLDSGEVLAMAALEEVEEERL